MAVKTYGIIIGNSLLKIAAVPYRYPVSVRIMTIPACKSLISHLEMDTLPIFRIDLLKMIFCKLRITTMTIEAIKHLFHSQFSGMWKFCILIGMAVGTTEAPVI